MQDSSLPRPLHTYLFARVPATLWRRMRVCWALLVWGSLVVQWPDVALLYSGDGIVPITLHGQHLLRFPSWSLLLWIRHPTAVYVLYILLLAALLAAAVGIGRRISLICAWVLLASFHVRNPLPMGGGDVLLHNIGFLLMIAPGTFCRRGGDSETMPVWPIRLLLWQIILIYVMSGWQKLMGTTWLDGTAVGMPLRHPHFARFPDLFSPQFLSIFSPVLGYGTIAFLFAWLLVLIPGWTHHDTIRRGLIVIGVCFHLGIFLLLKVGTFSPAMFVAFIGLWTPIRPEKPSETTCR